MQQNVIVKRCSVVFIVNFERISYLVLVFLIANFEHLNDGWKWFVCILTLSWRRPLPYRNQSIDLLRKSMDWFLYDNDLRRERVKPLQWLPDEKRIMLGCHLFNNCNWWKSTNCLASRTYNKIFFFAPFWFLNQGKQETNKPLASKNKASHFETKG